MEIEQTKLVLICGNGFDLAHNLPTSYEDFIDFVLQISALFQGLEIDGVGQEFIDFDGYEKRCRLSDEYISKLNHIIQSKMDGEHDKAEFYEKPKKRAGSEYINLKNAEEYLGVLRKINANTYDCNYGLYYGPNPWFEYFADEYEEYKRRPGPDEYNRRIVRWSGFEEEIKALVKGMTDNYKNGSFRFIDENVHAVQFLKDIAQNRINIDAISIRINVEETRRIIAELEMGLQQLIKALEIYITYFVPFWIDERNRREAFEKFNFDAVVNFNYTDTFRELYGSKKCFFVHGKAWNNYEANVVLGIDEFLDDDETEKQVEFLEYRKFYQRLSLNTDYVKLNDELKSLGTFISVFYGHSMSVLDKEVLLDLLPVDENGQVSEALICSYDEKSRKRQIAELVKILGMKELTELMCGEHPRIELINNDDLMIKLSERIEHKKLNSL